MSLCLTRRSFVSTKISMPENSKDQILISRDDFMSSICITTLSIVSIVKCVFVPNYTAQTIQADNLFSRFYLHHTEHTHPTPSGTHSNSHSFYNVWIRFLYGVRWMCHMTLDALTLHYITCNMHVSKVNRQPTNPTNHQTWRTHNTHTHRIPAWQFRFLPVECSSRCQRCWRARDNNNNDTNVRAFTIEMKIDDDGRVYRQCHGRSLFIHSHGHDG